MTDLEDRVDELERENKALKARVDAFEKKFQRLNELLGGDGEYLATVDPQMAESVIPKVNDMEDRLDDVEQDAAAAVAENKARADGGSDTKVDIARRTARNELVRRCAKSTPKPQLPYTKVKEMARPQHDIAYQTIKDAVADLEVNWECISSGTNNDGQKVIRIEIEQIPRELIRLAENDLDQGDLTKRLISRIEQEGAKA